MREKGEARGEGGEAGMRAGEKAKGHGDEPLRAGLPFQHEMRHLTERTMHKAIRAGARIIR